MRLSKYPRLVGGVLVGAFVGVCSLSACGGDSGDTLLRLAADFLVHMLGGVLRHTLYGRGNHVGPPGDAAKRHDEPHGG